MSQEYFPGDGRHVAESSSSSSNPARHSESPVESHQRPTFMTVGSGQPSASAAALTALLDDSGYGGSLAGSGVAGSVDSGWHSELNMDMPEPSSQARIGIDLDGDSQRHSLASHVHQLHFNQNRVTLGRAINRTIETLKGLQEMNATWPAHYPSVHRQDTSPAPHPRPGLVHTQTTGPGLDRPVSSHGPSRPGGGLRRAFTVSTAEENNVQAESSSAMEQRTPAEPRLITPQIAQEFSILKLDLKLGALTQTELVHSLEKQSIASLLDGKIGQSIRHLLSLRDRIEDTSSKVLVTGDLNAGKSTFCNALLRRKLLPEDQQPCTSIFCEVLDARENAGVEEVHAVHKDLVYNRLDESTYDVYRLSELEKIVVDNDHYTQAKVYVKDIRSVDESLLNNGVVDISLIDAPGLNMDSLKTHAVFAREEEIDVVVFVVSAANHFTLSAKEFIWNAAREKAYIFIVVNGFDMIRDKERCQRMILEQVASLSPRTFKESAELVHFVSSNAIPVMSPAPMMIDGGNGGGGGAPSPDDGHDDDDELKGKREDKGKEVGRKDRGKGKEKEKIQDFENLEQALRRFVLEKRARSKLAPAKTYLLNVLGDLNTLATVNRDVAQSESDRVTKELEELEPVFERSKKAQAEVSEEIDRSIEETCTKIYDHTRTSLTNTITRMGSTSVVEDLGVPYPGIWHAYQYAEEIKFAMLDQITATVTACEDDARQRTVQGVSSIKALGLLHLGSGSECAEMTFRSELMFRKKRDVLARSIDTPVEMWDFFDVAGLLQRQEKVAGTGMAMTVVGILGGRMLTGAAGLGWVDGVLGAVRIFGHTAGGTGNIRRLILPGLLVAGLATMTSLLLSIPRSLPRRLSAKLETSLQELNYAHVNAHRISTKVRSVLNVPANELRVNLSRSVENLGVKTEETTRIKIESDVARKYFGNLLRDTTELSNGVDAVDLDGPVLLGGQ
ncbi:MAG: mitofusin [Peltula sp. TS41687]|nr:MAG: mitofusin [Peltula sp. TS41687]